MKTLYVAWKDSVGNHAWFPVGRLDADVAAHVFRFRYVRGALAAEAHGFAALDSFPNLQGEYASAEIFPFFANRLFNDQRSGFRQSLDRLDLETETTNGYDPIEVLARSEGQRATENFEVFPKVERTADGKFAIKFFLHGWRHIPGAEDRIAHLRRGEPLGLGIEFTNPVTRPAIQLQTVDPSIIGWAPRYLIDDLARIITADGMDIEATVARINPSPAPPGQRVLISFRARWPEAFAPMSSEQYQPLVADHDPEFSGASTISAK
jgi:hypothetical protein